MSAPAITLRVAEEGDSARLLPMIAALNQLEGIVVPPAPLAAALSPACSPIRRSAGLAHPGGRRAVRLRGGHLGLDLEFAGRDAPHRALPAAGGARAPGSGAGAEAEIAALGAGALHLMVRPENAAAVALYRGAGYESPPRVLLSKRL